MLQFATIQPETLGLLRQLMAMPVLAGFKLAGGTALALKYGHRLSVDIDLFINQPFNQDETVFALQQQFGAERLQVLNLATNSINCIINNVKVDLLAHRYPIISSDIVEDGIRLFSIPDIAAMKIGAASSRGSKKDFYDLYELLQHYSINQLLSFYQSKYEMNDIWFIVRSLSYFEDAEISETPIALKGQEWETIKAFISQTMQEYLPD